MTFNKKILIGSVVAAISIPAIAFSMSHMEGEGHGCKKEGHGYEMSHDSSGENHSEGHKFLIDHLTQMLNDPELTEEQKLTIKHHLMMMDQMEKHHNSHEGKHEEDHDSH